MEPNYLYATELTPEENSAFALNEIANELYFARMENREYMKKFFDLLEDIDKSIESVRQEIENQ